MTLPISKYVWFDKKYVLTEKAKVPITTHAIHYGTSILKELEHIGMEKTYMCLD